MNNKINLPLWETVRHSFMYTIKNLPVIAKISSVFLILWLICIAMEINLVLDPNVTFNDIWETELLCATLTALASTIVSVSFIRHIIQKQQTKWFHLSFGMNNIKFIGWNILLFLIVFLPSFFILAGAALADYQGVSASIVKTLSWASLFILLIMLVYVGRVYIIYAASAINAKLTLQKAFALTQGNTFKIFCGTLILLLPTIILTHILIKLYQLPDLNIAGACFLSLLSMTVTFFDSSIKASYYSHLYQFFTYFDKEQPVKTVEKKETVIVKSEPAAKTVKEKTAAPKKTAPKKKAPAKTKAATKKATNTKTTETKAKPVAAKPVTKKTTTKKPAAKKATTPKPVAKKAEKK